MLGPKVYFGPKAEAWTLNWSLTLKMLLLAVTGKVHVLFIQVNVYLGLALKFFFKRVVIFFRFQKPA